MTVLLLAGGHCAFAKKSKTIEVETAKFAKSDSTAEVSVLVQWPVKGGIHGYTTEVGFTFRKSDGKQIPLLGDTNSPEFAQLLKNGVKQRPLSHPNRRSFPLHPIRDSPLLLIRHGMA